MNAWWATAGKAVSGKKRLTMAVAGKPDAGRTGFDLRGRSIVHVNKRVADRRCKEIWTLNDNAVFNRGPTKPFLDFMGETNEGFYG